MKLETERLILRAWDTSDAEECFKYTKDDRVGPITGWPVHTSVDECRTIIEKVLMVPETYAIVLKETNLVIGSIGLHFSTSIASNSDEAELGYWIGPKYWGRGLAPEAGKELLRHAFDDLKLNKVWCAYFEGNNKSKRVQEKLGFVFDKIEEDFYVTQLNETKRTYVSQLTRENWLN